MIFSSKAYNKVRLHRAVEDVPAHCRAVGLDGF